MTKTTIIITFLILILSTAKAYDTDKIDNKSKISIHINSEECTACFGANVNNVTEFLDSEYDIKSYVHCDSKFNFMKYKDLFNLEPVHSKESIASSNYTIENQRFIINGDLHQLSNSLRIRKFVQKKLEVHKVDVESNGFVFSIDNWKKINDKVYFSDFYKGTVFTYSDNKIEKINIGIDSLVEASIKYEDENPVQWSDSRIDTLNHYVGFIEMYNNLHRIYSIYNDGNDVYLIFSFMDKMVPYFNRKLSEKERLMVSSSTYKKDLNNGKIIKYDAHEFYAILESENKEKYEYYKNGNELVFENKSTNEVLQSFDAFFSVIDLNDMAVLYSNDSIFKYNYIKNELNPLSFDLDSKHQILGYKNEKSKNIVFLDFDDKKFGIEFYDLDKYYENFKIEIPNSEINNEKIVGILDVDYNSENYNIDIQLLTEDQNIYQLSLLD